MPINDVRFAHFTRYFYRIGKANAIGHQLNRHCTRDEHTRQNDEHLLHLGIRNGFWPPKKAIHRHQSTRHDVCPVQIPTQNSGQNDGRCGDGYARRKRAWYEKKERCQNPRFGVKTFFQKLISRKNFEPFEQRNERNRNHNHRQRQAKIELHEAHTVRVSLSRGGQKCDGTRLSRHHRKCNVIPRHFAVCQQITFHAAVCRTPFPKPKTDNAAERYNQNEPINWIHKSLILKWIMDNG